MSQIFFLYKFRVINIDSKYIYVKIFSLTGYLDVFKYEVLFTTNVH
jgi:hypothetical protein